MYILTVTVWDTEERPSPQVWIPVADPTEGYRKMFVMSRINEHRADIMASQFGLLTWVDNEWQEWCDEAGRGLHTAFDSPLVLDISAAFGGPTPSAA